MKLYEVFTPEIDATVRYKLLSPEEVEIFVAEHKDHSREDFITAVLRAVIYNLKSDVTEALKKMSKTKGRAALDSLFNGCVMLNPGIDINSWLRITAQRSYEATIEEETAKRSSSKKNTPKQKKITRAKFIGLERHLKSKIIGQNEAIDEVVNALKRSLVGLNDDQRPLGVFLFAGASGVGKTHLARELHRYLFPEAEIVRVDCGEYQHKHENQKLLGAPPGYLGHDEGGQLTNAMLKNPQTVVLLDEVEKAHPDLWNTFLRVFDEGILTDGSGRVVNFREAIIVMTTNLGNSAVVDQMLTPGVGFKGAGIDSAALKVPSRSLVTRTAQEAIRKQFKPEFLNRIDKTVVFNHLSNENLLRIGDIEFLSIEEKLSKKGYTLTWDENAVDALIKEGVSPVQGARGLSQVRRDRIENTLADLILSGRFTRGTNFQVTFADGEYRISGQRPKRQLDVASQP